MRTLLAVANCLLILELTGAQSDGGPPLIEIKVPDGTYVGKPIAHNQSVCWLVQQDGFYTEVPLANVTSFRQLDATFQPQSSVEVRNQLRRELGHGWEVMGSAHYLVCARNDKAAAYARIFEELYGSFRQYFRTRGFSLPEPEFPLVAIVFPSVSEFAEFCREDGLGFVPGLRGYYRKTTNRIVLFDPGEPLISSQAIPVTPRPDARVFQDYAGVGHTPQSSPLTDIFRRDAAIQSDLANTLIHEGTHQIAYNLGLHNRIGENPKWIIEGLATMFEAAGARQNRRAKAADTRANPERLEWFREFSRTRRPRNSLATFVADDQLFSTSTLDAYSQAWALTFYLAETRSSTYAGYIRRIAERDPLASYGPGERLKDFQQAFGQDVARLEISFLRFTAELESTSAAN